MATEHFREFIAGAAGGVAQVLIGQPFDLIKVRLQIQHGSSAFAMTRKVWTTEGPLAFYKGSLLPLLGVDACVSVQFGAFEAFCGMLKSLNLERGDRVVPLSTYQLYLAGGLAGVTNSVISGPIEHIRIRLQTQPSGSARLYCGPLDCARKIMRTFGIAGLYRGQVVTLLREFHGYGIWFAAYEACVRYAAHRADKPREQLPNHTFALCGGVAGEALWLGSHPLDVLKSKMQSDGFCKLQRYPTLRSAFTQTWQSGGFRALFSGLGPALLRALPVSAGTFGAVELCRTALS
ncbi:mitochondrial carrier protein [Polychaeton citri CBS 116435]|uniref:Mitochondrial carrier protein n=1 Tax=Polychaeton citri CBS 116435 TaxID=1314669 RepID=A0A9P4PY34_9PEZI|nr:mitochondrial carrier protein [Polychaeton citri CBS 116435]